MRKNIWEKFNLSDLCCDPALRQCSFEARWMWVELLRLIYDARDGGRLTIKTGEPYTTREIADAIGCDIRRVNHLLKELGRNKVYSLDPDGAIYSRRVRRMAVDNEISTRKRTEIAPRSPRSRDEVGRLSSFDSNKINKMQPPKKKKKEIESATIIQISAARRLGDAEAPPPRPSKPIKETIADLHALADKLSSKPRKKED